jgi:DNA modification methylase
MKDFDWIDVADLKPWLKNPRWNDQAVVPVAESIEEFGFGAPIVVQAGSNMIIAGHTRLKAALKLGWKKVPCRILEITDRNAERLAIADNKTNEIADWNEEHLQEIMSAFEPEELENLGFTDQELNDLLGDNEDQSDENETVSEPPKAYTNQTFTLLKGDCLERLKELEDASIDAVVSDPPYEIDFMGKGWDRSGIAYSVELWSECLRVLKPGGHLIAFCATRTVHRMTVGIEDAGFEIRDQLCWCYESGFPKSLNVSKQFEDGSEEAKRFEGWGTNLKPAFEPAVLARKPVDGTIANNFVLHGVGGLNIEKTRFPYGDPIWFGSGEEPNLEGKQRQQARSNKTVGNGFGVAGLVGSEIDTFKPSGRWPANIVRFKKAQRSEREEGLDHLEAKKGFEAVHRKEGSAGVNNPRAGAGRTAENVKNFHPTVKPLELMRWLVRLVTPKEGVVLDPFLGSGTTAAAAMLEGVSCVGCEITSDYWKIIEARVENAKRQYLEGFENDNT